jgi:hypothetical protein
VQLVPPVIPPLNNPSRAPTTRCLSKTARSYP